ncbi:MAG: GNAT family N-acetyltransferase [Oscillospiraceae bacterium]|nr:GNAT family N-acetyltransferase [Oscillospiraceae bacterium]
MHITLKRVSARLVEYKKIKELYNSAFPSDERAPFMLLMAKAGKENVDFWSVYADKNWVGFVYVVNDGVLSYVFYLAINASERGRGYGSAVLRTLKRLYDGQKLFLALEQLDESAENYTERLNRRHFYEKNGLLPIDGRIREGNVYYDIMGIGGTVTAEDYGHLMESYCGKILKRLCKIGIV